MNKSDTAKLLAKAALIDRRTIDVSDVEAWHEAVGHLDARDAMAALTLHRQRSSDYLQPAHIIALARESRRDREHDEARERAKRALPPPPPTPMPPWFREFLDNLGKMPGPDESVAGQERPATPGVGGDS